MGLGQQVTGCTVTNHQRTPHLGHQAPVLRGRLLRRRGRTVQQTRGCGEHLNRLRLQRRQLCLGPGYPGKTIQRPINNPLQRIIRVCAGNTSNFSATMNGSGTGNSTTATREHSRKSSHGSVNRRLRLHQRRIHFHS
jgi:hypothetical protein